MPHEVMPVYSASVVLANRMKAFHENANLLTDKKIKNLHKDLFEESRYFRNKFAHVEGRVDDDFDWAKFGDFQERACRDLEGPILAAITKHEKEEKARASGVCKWSLLYQPYRSTA